MYRLVNNNNYGTGSVVAYWWRQWIGDCRAMHSTLGWLGHYRI